MLAGSTARFPAHPGLDVLLVQEAEGNWSPLYPQ